MLEPFFFGPEQRLFGIYHPPASGSSDCAVVVCPPLFDDYRRCYRALSELSKALAAKGCHVLRFDYSGTGNSWGELATINVTQWKKDIDEAIAELSELSGVRQIQLVGVRFGGLLALKTSNVLISRVVTWDPVISGKTYIDIIRHNDAIKKQQRLTDFFGSFEQTPDADYSNFIIGSSLSESIRNQVLNDQTFNDLVGISISTDRAQAFGNEELRHLSFDSAWDDYGRYYGELLMPKPVLSKIIEAVCEK